MVPSETKVCQNCRASFVIDASDFNFYEKIQVPPPTWCWQCRLQRRMTYRNERTLYKRKCNAPGHDEELISVFSPDKPFTVYDDRYWWSDTWDPLAYGKEYDFGKQFFLQFRELLERVPLIAVSITNMVNCSYCNVSEGDKGCYLISASEKNENTMYSNRIARMKDSCDVYIGGKSELCYEIVNCTGCYRVFFSRNAVQCTNSAFLYDCVGCNNCFGCTNLRNKSYYFFNEPCTKEEYEKRLREFDLGSFRTVTELKKRHRETLLCSIHRFAHILKSTNVTGDNIENAKNCQLCFDSLESPSAEDSKFLWWGGLNCKDSYDVGPGFGWHAEQLYEGYDTGIQSSRLSFTGVVYGSYDVFYSINCHGSNNLFGCYGLRSKQYCILNKQYSKEEYEALVPKIKKHMEEMPYVDAKGRIFKYGEFFPPDLSFFYYNETIAQEYFPLTKEEAHAKGYRWRDPEERNYQIQILNDKLPDHITDVADDILEKIIECGHKGKCNDQCATAFRIIPQELAFYRHMNLPLPRLCYNCRHFERLKQRNPLKLWHRKCTCAGATSDETLDFRYQNSATHFHGTGHCPNEFETSYAPERPEIVYCEACYNAEVV